MRSTILLLLLALVLACSAKAANQSAADRGRFVVKPPEVESAAWRAEARSMQDSGTLQELASALNDIFVLPHDIGLRYVECGEANAYYNAETYEIQMCLELMQNIAETLPPNHRSESAVVAVAPGHGLCSHAQQRKIFGIGHPTRYLPASSVAVYRQARAFLRGERGLSRQRVGVAGVSMRAARHGDAAGGE